DEVTVTKWLKQVGDSIKELEPLLEVNTDKVDTEIPAPASGVILKIEMQEGDVAKVGELLAVIGAAGEAVASNQLPVISETKPSAEPSTGKADESQPITQYAVRNTDLGFISPVVAKIAAERGVDLSQITGTGLNGRITKNDVLAFAENRESGGIAPTAQPSNLQPANVKPVEGDQLIKHTNMRRSIAQHMLDSKRISPQVLSVMEADMSRVMKHFTANEAAFARDGITLTLTAYFMSAIVAGLKAYPIVNSSWSDEGILIHKDINIGMAVSLGAEGLIVPVIKSADNLSLLAMARTVNDLARRARAKKLHPDEVKGGTFTLTNHGTGKSLFSFPILNQPQCGILGTGIMQNRVVAIDDAIAIRPMIYLSFVFDHRVLDGASADWFLGKVKETMENWA
ncbi:MAG: 2-oxo acid dehydrogenase subunit E2, partial [Anaerolineales bacterium]|nr:2-oxo acid dehydrogenase subunit E2 [Anaerolineales bacterium]